jgi:hypothetical protein
MIVPYARQQIFASASRRDAVRQMLEIVERRPPACTRDSFLSYLDIFAAGANGRPKEL